MSGGEELTGKKSPLKDLANIPVSKDFGHGRREGA